jgi:hypothetical protein
MDWQDIKDKIGNMPGCMVMPVVLLCVFIPLLLFEAIQKSDNSKVREAVEMRAYETYEEEVDSLTQIIDSLSDELGED